VGKRHGDMRVDQAHGRVELEERQREDGGRRHPVREQPEEQVLVAHEVVAAEGIGGRQRHGDRDDRVHHHVDQRVDVTHVPAGIGQDHRIVAEGQVRREEGKRAGDLGVGLQAHVQKPVDRDQEEQEVDRHHDGIGTDAHQRVS